MICPNCKHRIPLLRVRDRFRCSKCNANLESNAKVVGIILLSIWIFIPLPLFFEMIFERFKGTSTIVIIGLYMALGIGALVAGLELFGKCRISDGGDAK